MTSVRNSLIFSLAEKYIGLLIQLFSSMIVARLVTPEQFGIFAVAFSLISFTQAIRDMGVNSYIIHKKSLSNTDVRACLFVTFTSAWLLASSLFLLSPVIEDLYGADVRLSVRILLLNLMVMPISSTIFAVLQREMRFDLLLRINLAGAFTNAALAIALAASGWGPLSLAWACVAGQLASAVVAACYRPHLHHFLPSYTGAREVFRFGSVVMLGTLLSQISTNVANLITAKFVTLDELGLFSRSQSVSGLFGKLIMDGIQPLLLPFFSGITRKNISLAPSIEKLTSYVAVVSWPFFGFLAVCSKPLILLMFGWQWEYAAYLLIPVSIAGMFWVVACVLQPILVALGRADVTLRIQIINQVISLVLVVLSAMYGVTAVAIAAIPISAAHGCIWLFYSARVVDIGTRRLVRTACWSGFVTMGSLVLPLLTVILINDAAPLIQLVCCAGGAASGWIACVFLCRHPISDEIGYLAGHAKKTARAWLNA